MSCRIEESPLTALMQATKGNSYVGNRRGEPRSVDSTGGVVCTKIGCFSQSEPAGQGQILTLHETGLCPDTTSSGLQGTSIIGTVGSVYQSLMRRPGAEIDVEKQLSLELSVELQELFTAPAKPKSPILATPSQ